MKYYAIINEKNNKIISWCGIDEDVTVKLNDNEIIHPITHEQVVVLGSKEAEFTIENEVLILGQLFDKVIIPETQAPTVQEQLDSMKEAIDFLIMGGF